MEIIGNIFTFLIVIGAGYFAYMSSVMVDEKKQRQRERRCVWKHDNEA
jgi:uncharacterized membrane protein